MSALLDSVLFHLHNPARAELLAGLAAISGSAIHWGVFMHGEWHVAAPKVVLAHMVITGLLFLRLTGQEVATICLSYTSTLITSIIVYRLWFHRLSGFKGPRMYAVSKIWHMWKCRASQNHHLLADLHKKYGDFVRTGPTEVTVFHPDVFMAIDGPRSECIKADWYDLLHPNLSLVTARVKSLHASRRRQWNKGFNPKAMSQYERRFISHIDELDACLEADVKAQHTSDATNLFSWFCFDAMGSFVFNKSFNMLRDRQWHHIIVILRRALSLLGPLSPVPWLIQIGFKLFPRIGLLGDWFGMIAWCENQMEMRVAQPEDETTEPDVAHYLIEDVKTSGYSREAYRWLSGDALLAIVAGSEPTASTLVGLFHHITSDKRHTDKIYEEIKNIDRTDVNAIAKCAHLDACIQEALRLFPAPPTGGNRTTGPNGVWIGDVFIPPFTTIVAPRFTISQRDDCFVRGSEFLPERWTEQPELLLNRAAYAPFGTGSNSCLGRALAVAEMRLVLARLIHKYEFEFAPEQGRNDVVGNFRDQFTPLPGRLRLVFKLRK